MDDFISRMQFWAEEYGVRLAVAVIILLVGLWLSKRLSRWVATALVKARVDQTLANFLKNIAYGVLMAVVAISALNQLGVSVASFLAVLGAAGLAVGLALKDSLSNFAAGVMLVLNRYYKVGDYVTVAGTSGTVTGLNLFNTELATPDNQKVFVPNAGILNGVIVNVTANDIRRLDLVMSVGYGDDLDKARQVIGQVLSAEERILADPAVTVAVSELADSSVNFVVRPWVRKDDYWPVHFALVESLKKAFDENGLSIPFPQREIHVYQHSEN